jgi:hypothetical protein
VPAREGGDGPFKISRNMMRPPSESGRAGPGATEQDRTPRLFSMLPGPLLLCASPFPSSCRWPGHWQERHAGAEVGHCCVRRLRPFDHVIAPRRLCATRREKDARPGCGAIAHRPRSKCRSATPVASEKSRCFWLSHWFILSILQVASERSLRFVTERFQVLRALKPSWLA